MRRAVAVLVFDHHMNTSAVEAMSLTDVFTWIGLAVDLRKAREKQAGR